MSVHGKLGTKQLALAVSFAALYVVFGALKISPIIGLPGQAITAAAIIAPVMGIIFGPYIGTLSTFFGGIIGLSLGFFSPPSVASGVIATLCGGTTSKGKRSISTSIYLILLLLLAFYPVIGPARLYPPLLLFQIIGLTILVSPLQSVATKNLDSNSNPKLLYAFFVTSLTSTLAGQIAGSLTFEAILLADVNLWTGTWIATAFLYPIERTIIAISAGLIGAALIRVMRAASLMPSLNRPHRREKCS
jgi:hypothetical protein